MARAQPSAGLMLPTILTIAALAVLLGLGTWQLQRKAWKDGLIAQIAARTTAPPIAFDDALARALKGDDLEYTRVAVTGRWLAGREAHLWAPTTAGPGWHVYAPLATATGRVVIVQEAAKTMGFAAEVSATIAERFVDLLESPIVRVAGWDAPYPPYTTIEQFYRPDARRVAEGIKKAMEF